MHIMARIIDTAEVTSGSAKVVRPDVMSSSISKTQLRVKFSRVDLARSELIGNSIEAIASITKARNNVAVLVESLIKSA